MVSLEIVALVLTGLGLPASIVYYANILSNANKTQQLQLETRQAQLFMPIYSTYHSEEYIKAFSEIMKWKYDSYDDYMA